MLMLKAADLLARGLNLSYTGTTRAEDRHLALPREHDPTEVFILQGKHQEDVNIQVLLHVQQSCLMDLYSRRGSDPLMGDNHG